MSIYSTAVSAAIYSTATAAFLLYKTQELLAEWERLRTLPPEKIATENGG
jgi:uncharacterized protein YmfQ (DUF2313 family)